eukprot:1156864-Pelagomonas_calceolata.AAC.3
MKSNQTLHGEVEERKLSMKKVKVQMEGIRCLMVCVLAELRIAAELVHVPDLALLAQAIKKCLRDKLLEQGHLLDGVNGSLDRPVKGFNEAGKAQQLEGFKPPWGRLSWLGGLSLWVAFTQLIANKYVECGSPSYWCVSAQPCRCGWESVRSHVDVFASQCLDICICKSVLRHADALGDQSCSLPSTSRLITVRNHAGCCAQMLWLAHVLGKEWQVLEEWTSR